MIDEDAITSYITTTLVGVETAVQMGYTFFFYSDDHMLPFATLISEDNEYDRYSNLDRPGVFRLNVGVSRETFESLFGPGKVDVSGYDFSALDTFMPHPEYAPQSFICVLNPSDETYLRLKEFLKEAYEIAVRRYNRRTRTSPGL